MSLETSLGNGLCIAHPKRAYTTSSQKERKPNYAYDAIFHSVFGGRRPAAPAGAAAGGLPDGQTGPGSREPCCWPCSFGGLWPWSPSWCWRLWPISSLIFSPGGPSSTSFWPILWCRDSLRRGSSTGFSSGAPGMSPILTTGLTAWCTGSLSPWALPRWRMCCMCSPPAFPRRWCRAIFSIPGHAMFGVVMGEAMSRAKWLEVHGQREQAGAAGGGPGFCPAVLHGLYDFLLVGFGWIFYGYFAGLVVYVVRLLRQSAREDGPINL